MNEIYLNDIILPSQIEHLPSNIQGDDGERWNHLTVNKVLWGRGEDMLKWSLKTKKEKRKLNGFVFFNYTSPISRGRAPMALCSTLISSRGPTIRDVPVSTIAWQLALQRVSWLPTSTLRGGLEREWQGRAEREKEVTSVQCHHRASWGATDAPALMQPLRPKPHKLK